LQNAGQSTGIGIMNRWKASGLHLLLSICVIGGIALTTLLVWFPHGLYKVADLDRLMLIMLGIDLTVGPLLTLVVYKPGKASLKWDLTVIALCQIAFMGYGLHTLWQARPVFLVASDVRLNLVFANEIEPQDLVEAPRQQWRRLSWMGPQLVGVKPPASAEEKSKLLTTFLSTGRDLESMPRYYVDYGEVATVLLRHGKTNATHKRGERNASEMVLVEVPLISRYGEAVMLVDGVHGQPVRVADGPIENR